MAKCLLLDSQLIDDFVSRNNIRREGSDLLFFLIGLHGALQCNFAVYRNDLDVVRVSREILVTDDRLANLGGGLTVSFRIRLIVRRRCGVLVPAGIVWRLRAWRLRRHAGS